MSLSSNISLKPYNTFGIDVSCKLFTEIYTKEDLYLLIDSNILNNEKYFILGGGSNILFTQNFDGLIIKPNNQSIEILDSTEDFIWIKAGAGVVWNDLVEFTLVNNLSGIENLIDIPGTVGASAYQNIGAYGVEAKDVIEEVEIINLFSKKNYFLKKDDCGFSYRNSIFKENKNKNEFIYSVIYKLSTQPKLNTSYGNIQKEIIARGIENPAPSDIATIIKEIRNDKLPDPDIIGNGGSFFKNPIISIDKHDLLKNKFPDLVSFAHNETTYKISAAWLIDQCGWKGKSIGNAGVYEKQALVLVNLGNATGEEILHLATEIQISVKEKFDVEIEPEIIII